MVVRGCVARKVLVAQSALAYPLPEMVESSASSTGVEMIT